MIGATLPVRSKGAAVWRGLTAGGRGTSCRPSPVAPVRPAHGETCLRSAVYYGEHTEGGRKGAGILEFKRRGISAVRDLALPAVRALGRAARWGFKRCPAALPRRSTPWKRRDSLAVTTVTLRSKWTIHSLLGRPDVLFSPDRVRIHFGEGAYA